MVFLKDATYNLTNDYPEGSYLVLKIKYMFPGYKPIIDVGLKYNYHNVLYLIATEDEEATQDGITYLYTYAVSDYIPQSIFFFPLFFWF